MPGRYVYSPLEGPRDIRLLEIGPGVGSEEIEVSISHVSLESDPEYEALSYTWALSDADIGPEIPEIIRCGGCDTKVTPNLHAALLHLRRSNHGRVLWIDAVCIDQHNLEEKGKQVQLMSHIYSRAKSVVAWLGKEEDTDALAFQTVRRLNDFFTSREEDLCATIDLDIWQEEALPRIGSWEWVAFARLLRKRWFRRVWIIQEVVMAKEVLVICGHQEVSWDMLEYVIVKIKFSGLSQVLAFEADHGGQSRLGVMSMVRSHIKGGEHIDFSQILTMTRLFEASDPRDKVYSLLGLVQAGDNEIIMPDYTITVEELYRATAIFWLKDEPFLTLLSFVEWDVSPNEKQDSPSWIPQWPAASHLRNPFAPFAHCFQATGSRWKSQFRVLDHEGPLTVCGLFLDVVEAIGPASPAFAKQSTVPIKREDVKKNIDDLCIWFVSCESILPSGSQFYQHSKQALQEAFSRTIICNLTPAGQAATAEYDESYQVFREVLNIMCTGQQASYDRKSIEIKSHKGMLYEQSFAHWVGGRVFCVTREHHYMGMLPSATTSGDIVCAFLAAKTPFVIRPTGDTGSYRLVGECYIHGLMNGEIMQFPDFSKRLQDIVLR